MLKLFKKAPPPATNGWNRAWTEHGISLSRNVHAVPLVHPLLQGFLSQLQDDGYALATTDGFLIGWDSLFEALESKSYTELSHVLALPAETAKRPELRSKNSLTDSNFAISIAGWQDANGVTLDCTTLGAILRHDETDELMQPEQWRLVSAIVGFARRTIAQRGDLAHRQAWGRIRKLAVSANARFDDFLFRSVVLTPAKLEIGLRKSVVAEDSVIEIEPGFADAPPGWLARFDSEREVRDRYDFSTPEGVVQVLIVPQVKTVLQEIKRLTLRRVAGSRAQAFILNPFATLGEDATDVIVEEQFEEARESAGLQYERYLPVVDRDSTGYPIGVGLLIESADACGPTSSEKRWLTNDDLRDFIQKLEIALDRQFQLLGWKGYDFELQGEAPTHLAQLKSVMEERSKPQMIVSHAQVHDLSAYSPRIEGIGKEKPYSSLYIENESGGLLTGGVEPVVDRPPPAANADDQDTEPTGNAAPNGSESKPQTPSVDDPPQREKPKAPSTLILRTNIVAVEYAEKRREALQDFSTEPQLPTSLNPNYTLLPHQRSGVAWLQHLHRSQSEHQVRGAVLADDMGLGKTLQLIAFMAELVEANPSLDPMLVVAPVSLLENWREEIEKFLLPGALKILTAYGNTLAPLRVPRAEIDQRLLNEDGLVRFLKPKWIGDAKVVLTTYETLRDLEFSFAAQHWSVMVCDEAQRIKNPAAMVTRASKKQNVGFKIACTGTPVENTLADLWCLFDYVQPGLLGALNDFGQRYRKPIEAKTDEEKSRVEELRSLIAPQILRRLKEEVATNLPSKIIFQDCRSLPLSPAQRDLYVSAFEDFKNRNTPGVPSPFKNHLGLLQYLRLICTDPRRHGLTAFVPELLDVYRGKAPKLDWLLKRLQAIKEFDEKVIVFCEFRNIQRLLQHYIEELFGIRAEIINGDTSSSAMHSDSRQKRIKEFQRVPGFGVIILSPLAVGFGVNIQGANHVVHYTRTWNPAKEDQASDRAYRIGQTKNVIIYYPVVCASDFKTFDVKLDELLEYKRELAKDMLNGAGDISPGGFDPDGIVPPGGPDSIDERIDIAKALGMNPRYLEGLAAALWNKRGYESCYCTPASNDKGVDAVAISGMKGVLIQTKASERAGYRLGWEAVKDVVGGHEHYKKKHSGVEFLKVAMTNQFFNASAHEQAQTNRVELVDQTELKRLLEKYYVSMLDVERFLFTRLDEGEVSSFESSANVDRFERPAHRH